MVTYNSIETADHAATGPVTWSEPDAKRFLADLGLSVPRGLVADEHTDLAAALASLTGPFVVKALAPTLVHKSDVGGVALTLADAAAVEDAMRTMRVRVGEAGHAITGFLVEEMAPEGIEVVIGAVHTEDVGWSLMVGLGGIFVEILQDVSFGLVPVSRAQVTDMFDSLRASALLRGARGQAAVDVAGLVDIVMAMAGPEGFLLDDSLALSEIDLNPVIATNDGAWIVDARFVTGPKIAAAAGPARAQEDLARLLEPQRVAVLGASTRGTNVANTFIRNLRAFGFDGEIIPVHPVADTVEGLPSRASLADIEGDIDYAYVALPAQRVSEALFHGTPQLRFAQVVSSGFGEVAEGQHLQHQLVQAAHRNGTRILGPNCIGIHSPWGRLTFLDRVAPDEGSVSVVSQSGGLSVDIVRLGTHRGLDFRAVISNGNCADLSPAELVDFFLDDARTTVIGLYLESLAEARAVLDVVTARGAGKPIVLLAGGRTSDGSSAAVSHTGALASSHHLWPALARQGSMLMVDTVHDFVDLLATLAATATHTTPITDRVLLFGNGGGTSVLAADAFNRQGLSLPRLPDEIVARLEDLGLPPGNGLSNPIDAPAGTLIVENGAVAQRILAIALADTDMSVVVAHINVGVVVSNSGHIDHDVVDTLIQSIARARDEQPQPPLVILVLRSDADPTIDAKIRDYTLVAASHQMPVLSELSDAARVVGALAERSRASRSLNRKV